jgi:hypothetical protein
VRLPAEYRLPRVYNDLPKDELRRVVHHFRLGVSGVDDLLAEARYFSSFTRMFLNSTREPWPRKPMWPLVR